MLEEMVREYKQGNEELRQARERYHYLDELVRGGIVSSEHYRRRSGGLSPQLDLILKKERASEIMKAIEQRQIERKKQIEELFRKIPDKKLRRIILERCYHNRKWEEIGLMVGISAKAAQLRYKRFFEKEAA